MDFETQAVALHSALLHGIIPLSKAKEWADGQIEQMTKPSGHLLDLSLAQRLNDALSALDAVPQPQNCEPAVRLVFRWIYLAIRADQITYRRAGRVLELLASEFPGELPPSFLPMHSFLDDLDVAEWHPGIDVEDVERDLLVFLLAHMASPEDDIL